MLHSLARGLLTRSFKKMAEHKNSWETSVSKKGEFVRKDSQFRNWISSQPGAEFPPEKGRYHLYVSLACPWAHRTLIVRNLKGLESTIGYTVVSYLLEDKGWAFAHEKDVPACTPDPLGYSYLREIYKMVDPEYSGNITVPVLFDLKTKRIVNNESSEIIRMLNSEFNEFSSTPEQKELDFYPASLRTEIDEINSWVYPNINNGVYRCGFATSQEAYETAFEGLFKHLDKAESILSQKRYLTGSTFTEADIRLFTTLIRFDAVYVTHFKTNLKRIADYPNLQGHTREIYQMPGVRETVDFLHIKNHYFMSHKNINPRAIVPKGPLLDFDSPHNRDAKK